MAETWRYRGQEIGGEQLAFLREFIRAHPTSSRWKLSRQLCEVLGWKQANGALRDVVCRGLLLMLERAGQIEMPPVRRTADEPLFNSLMEHYHYLAYEQPVGEHLKYLVWAQARPVACLAFSSAPRHLAPRDRFIGWGQEARQRNIRFLAYNTRFLILPWVTVDHLASHILGRMARRVSEDWQRVYAHPIYMLETFVDPARFRGTCYRAANWILLGRTTGRGKNDLTHQPNRPIKEVLGYPLNRRFRQLLVEG